MTALAWQTMLLLGLAYLLGCWLACLLRRMMGSAQDNQVAVPAAAGAAVATAAAATMAARQAAPATATAAPVATVATARVAAPAAPAAPVRDAFRRADTLEPAPTAARPAAAPIAHPSPAPVAKVAAPVQIPNPVPPQAPASKEETVARFERALTSTPAVQTPVVQTPVVPAPVVQAAAAPAPSTPSTPSMSAANAAVAAAAAAAAAAASVARPAVASAQPVVRVQAQSVPVAATTDDLKRIRTIDQGLEAALHRAGIRRYADIAGWKPADVARISADLGFKGRIEQENWIEQAQILARGEDTHYSSRQARGELANAKPVEDEGERARPPAVQLSPAATAMPAPTPVAAKLEAPIAAPVKAVVAAAAPAVAIVQANAAPAAATSQRTDVVAAAAAAAALAAAASAASTAAKAATATDAAPKEAAAVPVPGPVTAPDVSGHAAFAGRSGNVATAPAAAVAPASVAPASAPAAAGTTTRAVGSSRDGLQRIGGITPEIEKLLNVQGVSRYSQVAQWGKTDIERFDRLLGYQGRIQRENWIEQAQILARGGDTTYSREHDRRMAVASATPGPAAVAATPAEAKPSAPATPAPATPAAASTAAAGAAAAAAAASAVAAAATAATAAATSAADAAAQAARPSRLADAIRGNEARPSNDLSSLRSVRSEGMRGGATVPSGPGARPAEHHDLKRIRGIGVLIEKKLNSMGTTRYEQIAEWTTADIEKVSHALDFKGRIERENWVEQARILASGGQTEFSRRADRGDIGTPS